MEARQHHGSGGHAKTEYEVIYILSESEGTDMNMLWTILGFAVTLVILCYMEEVGARKAAA